MNGLDEPGCHAEGGPIGEWPELSRPAERAGTIAVSWGDCDASGIVFYPRFYAWFDACTHALLESLGLDHHVLRRDYGTVGMVLVHATANFRSPATYGDVLHAVSRIARVGTRSITVEHRFALPDRVVVEGTEIRVWAEARMDGASARPLAASAVPHDVRERLLGR